VVPQTAAGTERRRGQVNWRGWLTAGSLGAIVGNAAIKAERR